MSVQTRTVEYYDGHSLLEGYLAWDNAAGAGRPTVLIAHMWGGRVPFVCRKAEELAASGYTAFALDLYGKGVFGGGKEENARLSRPFIDDRSLTRRRMRVALETARSLPEVDPGNIAAIGYCFGGLCVLELARSGADVKGVVSLHGLLKPAQRKPEAVKAKILLLHGAEDPMAGLDSVLAVQEELTAAGADWQTVLYGHAAHAFTNPQANDPDFGTVYNADADRRSWQAMMNFLDEVLG